MTPLFKKVGFFLLKLIHPFFQYIAHKKAPFFNQIRASFEKDPYLCGMISRFNVWHEWIFRPNFEKVQVDPKELTQLKNLSQTGTLVYVMKNRGQLEYSFFNHRFLKEGIPLVRFANGCRTLYWRPFKDFIKAILASLDYFFSNGLLKNPNQSGYLENLVARGESALLNLKVSRELIFGDTEDPISFIPPLIQATRRSTRPVYLITQQFLYDRHPEKEEKSWIDLLFGEKSNPGMFRKVLLFIFFYRRRATVKFGEPLDLGRFIRENPGDDRELATKLKMVLLSHLMIERKSITGPPVISSEKVLHKMLESPSFKEEFRQYCLETSREKRELDKEVIKYFREIAAEVNYTYVDLYDRLIHWMVNNVYDGLDVDLEGLAQVQKIAGEHPVVLVPSHKSHIDYLLLSYVFLNYNLTLPHICAGINLKFWPIARMIRQGGGFFIRRSFSGNKLYKLVLEHYISLLVHEGYSIEFFIEGTRSRTGKLLKPRMGILSMLVKSFLDGVAHDIYFVPISIHYEEILEQKSYQSEIQGSDKEEENVQGIIKARKKLKRKHGKVFIRFASPISLNYFLAEREVYPNQQSIASSRHQVEEFAYRLTYEINKISLVTATSLVATVLLTHEGRGFSYDSVLKRARALKHYLNFKGVRFSDLIRQKEDWSYNEALQKLVRDRMIFVHQDFTEKFFTINDSQRSVLDYYKNNSLHFFVSLATFSKILQTSRKVELSLLDIKQKYEALKTLLRHDFTFSERASLEEHLIRIIRFYEGENLVTYDEVEKVLYFEKCQTNEFFKIYASLLNNFFESAYVTLLYIKYIHFEKIDRKNLERDIKLKGRSLHIRGTIKHHESLSHFNIRNMLLVFSDLGFIKSDEKGYLTRQYDKESIDQWEEILKSILGLRKISQETFKSKARVSDVAAVSETSIDAEEGQGMH